MKLCTTTDVYTEGSFVDVSKECIDFSSLNGLHQNWAQNSKSNLVATEFYAKSIPSLQKNADLPVMTNLDIVEVQILQQNRSHQAGLKKHPEEI